MSWQSVAILLVTVIIAGAVVVLLAPSSLMFSLR